MYENRQYVAEAMRKSCSGVSPSRITLCIACCGTGCSIGSTHGLRHISRSRKCRLEFSHLCKHGVSWHRRPERDDLDVSSGPLQRRPDAGDGSDAGAQAVAADLHERRLLVACMQAWRKSM